MATLANSSALVFASGQIIPTAVARNRTTADVDVCLFWMADQIRLMIVCFIVCMVNLLCRNGNGLFPAMGAGLVGVFFLAVKRTKSIFCDGDLLFDVLESGVSTFHPI